MYYLWVYAVQHCAVRFCLIHVDPQHTMLYETHLMHAFAQSIPPLLDIEPPSPKTMKYTLVLVRAFISPQPTPIHQLEYKGQRSADQLNTVVCIRHWSCTYGRLGTRLLFPTRS